MWLLPLMVKQLQVSRENEYILSHIATHFVLHEFHWVKLDYCKAKLLTIDIGRN